jgi:hypothetical protein
MAMPASFRPQLSSWHWAQARASWPWRPVKIARPASMKGLSRSSLPSIGSPRDCHSPKRKTIKRLLNQVARASGGRRGDRAPWKFGLLIVDLPAYREHDLARARLSSARRRGTARVRVAMRQFQRGRSA